MLKDSKKEVLDKLQEIKEKHDKAYNVGFDEYLALRQMKQYKEAEKQQKRNSLNWNISKNAELAIAVIGVLINE